MDKATERLNQASFVLLDAEVRLKTFNAQQLQIDKEIAMLTSVEAHLEENLRILRRRRVTVRIEEYKKARADLHTARTRKSFLRIDRENHIKLAKFAIEAHERAKADYEKAFELLHNPPNNVIQVDFRDKSGRQK